MTVRFGSIREPLADARGSEPSHDREGVDARQTHHITRSGDLLVPAASESPVQRDHGDQLVTVHLDQPQLGV